MSEMKPAMIVDLAAALKKSCERDAKSNDVVFVLLSSSERIVRVLRSESEANAIRDKYNADPFVDGDPDPGAPYSVEAWTVR